MGRPDDGHGLRPAGRVADRAAASCRTSTTSTSTGRSARCCSAAIYAVTGAAVWPAVALGLVARGRSPSALTYRLARRFAAPLPAGRGRGALVALRGAVERQQLLRAAALDVGAARRSCSRSPRCSLLDRRAARRARPRGRCSRPAPRAGSSRSRGPSSRSRCSARSRSGSRSQIWQARGARRPAWRAAALVAAPALALPARRLRAFLTPPSAPRELLLENLYPSDFVDAAGHVVLDAHAPLTAAQRRRARRARRSLRRRRRRARRRRAARSRAGGRRRTLALVGRRRRRCSRFVVASRCARRPSASTCSWLRWIPAGAWLAAAVLLWRARDARRPGGVPALLVALLLGAATANTYASFIPFPNALFPEATPYLLPLAAVFLVWLHVARARRGAPRGRGARRRLARRCSRSRAPGWSSTTHARRPATVRGPHGSARRAPGRGARAPAALDVIAAPHAARRARAARAAADRALRHGGPRRTRCRSSRCCRARSPTPPDEDARDRADGRRAPRGHRPHAADARTSTAPFGTTFDRRLAAWLRRDFRRLTHRPRRRSRGHATLDVWLRRTP